MVWTLTVFIILPLIGLAVIGAFIALVDLANAKPPSSLERQMDELRKDGERAGLWQRVEEIVRQ